MILKKTVYSTDISFGAIFLAKKQGIDALNGLRYKLMMRGIPISGPWDNMSVVHNTSRSKSVLRKKSNSVCYHTVGESVAMGESQAGHIPSKENAANLMTKVLYGQKRKYFISNILYGIHGNNSYQSHFNRQQSGKLDSIGNSIKPEWTRKRKP